MSPVYVYVFNLALVLLLVFANAFFVVSEFAIVKIRRTKLEELAHFGNKRAKIALKITENMLMDAGIDDYRFDSECLLIKAADKTRRDVLCHGDDVLSEQDEKHLLKLAKSRALGEP